MYWSVAFLLLLVHFSSPAGGVGGGRCSAARPDRRQPDQPLVCENVYQVECGQCQTVFQKVCSIEMQERVVERTVRKCRKYRNANCKDGYRDKCKTRFSSHCSTVMKIMEVVEDQPVCRTEKISSCAGDSTDCRQVEVNRCHIESRTVRRAAPDTRCERIPSTLCARQECEEGRVECQEEVVTGVEQVPVESCQFQPQEVCQEEEGGCRTIVRRICRRQRRRKLVCRKRNGGKRRGGNGTQAKGRRKRIKGGKRKRIVGLQRKLIPGTV